MSILTEGKDFYKQQKTENDKSAFKHEKESQMKGIDVSPQT